MRRKHVLSSVTHHFVAKFAPWYGEPFRINRRQSAVVVELTDDQGKRLDKVLIKNIKAYIRPVTDSISCSMAIVTRFIKKGPISLGTFFFFCLFLFSASRHIVVGFLMIIMTIFFVFIYIFIKNFGDSTKETREKRGLPIK